MKELIPIKKDIIFNTKIGEITNISLDYDYKINSDIVEGSIDLSGTYKMMESSILEDDFFYSIPFSVAIGNDVIKESIKIDIDDFKYKFNKDVLSVSIDLNFECDKENIMDIENENIDNDIDLNIEKEKDINLDIDKINDIDFNTKIEDNIVLNDSNIELDMNDNITNITNVTNNLFNIDNNYHTYKVYIVRPGDTFESICNKYNVSMDILKQYNNESINVGDKIIIPDYSE